MICGWWCGDSGSYNHDNSDTATATEGHKEGVLFTVHEENKGPFTVHEENKTPITVHEDNKPIYSTRVVNS